jgi:hypothetical protein
LAATVLIGCGATAAVWVASANTASANDCAVVESLGEEWVTMVVSVNEAIETGPGQRSDIVGIADHESAMSDRLRVAANSVSTAAFKDNFNKWADGIALTAQLERDADGQPLQFELPPEEQATMRNAADMTDEASGALLQACPNVRGALTAN